MGKEEGGRKGEGLPRASPPKSKLKGDLYSCDWILKSWLDFGEAKGKTEEKEGKERALPGLLAGC